LEKSTYTDHVEIIQFQPEIGISVYPSSEGVPQKPTALACVFWKAMDEYGIIFAKFNMLLPIRCMNSALAQALLNCMGK